MTQEQKKAILILNGLYSEGVLKEDDFFLLLEYVIQEQHTLPTPTVYMPFSKVEHPFPMYNENDVEDLTDKPNTAATLRNVPNNLFNYIEKYNNE